MTKPLRILHVSSYAPPNGGAARVMNDQVEAQRKYFDDQVSVVSFEPGFADLAKLGVGITQFRGISVSQDWLLRPKEYFTLWKLVGRAECVVLHSPYYFINCVAAMMSKLRRRRLVCIHHGHLPSEFRNKLNISLINRLVASWLILDPEHKAYLGKYVNRLKPTHLIQNGVWLDRLPHRAKASTKPQHFVYCGRVVFDKGMRELAATVKAFPHLQFTIVGSGEDLKLFEGFSNVAVKGMLPHDQAMQEVVQADCLLLPSYHETFPMAVVEALAMNLPVIVTDVSSAIRKLVEGNGLLIEPESSESLIAAVGMAARDGLSVQDSQKIRDLDWSRVIKDIRTAFMR